MKKALSIKQPWASLIAHGIKDIENRTWKTSYRGKILIHASGQYAKGGFSLLNPEMRRLANLCPKWNPMYLTDLPTSAIIGEVEIVDCVINYPSIWAEKSEHFGVNVPAKYGSVSNNPIYNWVLANAKLYDEPILNVKGKLSIWNYEDGIL
ncbi:ASCH domain-containing protein [Empedobacter falsenii]|uniref:ASCH domain-containing protein n=1 Tax=Empedobacter falsenii TaxID=343874 RepID=UPI003A801FEC